jgi:peptide/nickel transport system substrate-binding protein
MQGMTCADDAVVRKVVGEPAPDLAPSEGGPSLSTSGTAARAIALVAVSALGLAACATSSGGSGSSSSASSSATATTANTTIKYAYEQEFGAYNNNTADQNASKNAVVLNEVLRGFWQYAPDGTVAPDPEFGTYEKTSDNPLTVKYTINSKAVWSDGTPIECSDMVLAWAANSNAFPTGKKNSDGSPAYAFSTAGSTGYEQQNIPQCNKGDKTVTVTYKTPFADWNAMYGNAVILPAHVVEKQSGVPDIIAAAKNKDIAALTKAGTFYNTGWVFKPGQFKADISPAAGPYQIASWQAGQSLTLTPNPKWWGTPPKSKTIIFRFISQDQQAQALQNGEVQIMDPQPNPDTLNQLKNIGSSITVQNHDQFTFEHYDFNFRKGNPFADLKVRQAFAKCLPRETIVNNLVKPQNPNAVVQNSLYALPFQPNYKDLTANNDASQYDKTDIPGAKQLLQQAGKTGTQVRIGYQTPNPRRTQEVALVRDSCGQAGFKVVDAGQSDFFGNGLANGNWDVALFAWAGSAIVTSNSSTYVTGGGNNNGKYSNPQVDSLTKQLNSTLDPAKQKGLQAQLDKIVFSQDLASIPVFAFPAVLATDKKVQGVEYNASQSDVTFNASKWSLQTAA